MIITGILLNVVGWGCLLLGTVRARNPCITVLRRHDRGDRIHFKSEQVRSVPSLLASLRPVSQFVVGQFAFLRCALTRSFALSLGLAICDSGGSRRSDDVTLALAHFGISQEWWPELFAMLGAIAVGCTAWARVSILTEPALGPGVAFGPAQPPIGATTKAGDTTGLSSLGWDQCHIGSSNMTATSRSLFHTSPEPGDLVKQVMIGWLRERSSLVGSRAGTYWAILSARQAFFSLAWNAGVLAGERIVGWHVS